MNPTKLLASSLLVLAVAGCEKSTDLGRIQEETLATVKLHAGHVDVLQRRADALMVRGRTLGPNAPGIADAGRILSEARTGIDQLRMQVTNAPATLSNAVKSGQLEEVGRTSDELLEKLYDGELVVRGHLATVDSWLMTVENRPAAPPPVKAPTADTPPIVIPPTTPTADTGSPPAAGSGAGSAAGSAAPQK